MFVFDGKSSASHGVIVQYRPDIPHAVRQVTTYQIPGRNGNLTVDHGAFENYTQEYDVYIRGSRNGITSAAASVAQWLLAPAGYRRLEDNYNPDVFRFARFMGPLEVENLLGRYGKAVLQFDCKPQRFLKSGEFPITISGSGTLYNPTGFTAQPLIRAYGTGEFNINGCSVTINEADEYTDIDCDIQDAYKGVVNCNANIVVGKEFPVLASGGIEVSMTGISKLEIIPRWWTI